MLQNPDSIRLHESDIRDSGFPAAPIVPLTKSQSTASMGARSGFFRRIFSGNTTSIGNQVNGEEESVVPTSALRHKASNIFRKPGTAPSATQRPATTGRTKDQSHEIRNGHKSRGHVEPLPQSKHVSQLSIVNPLMPTDALTNDPDALVESLAKDHYHGNQVRTRKSLNNHTGLSCVEDYENPTTNVVVEDTNTAPLIPPVPDHNNAFGSLEVTTARADFSSLARETEDSRKKLNDMQIAQESAPIQSQSRFVNQEQSEDLVKAIVFYEWQDPDLAIEEYAAYLGIDEAINKSVREKYLGLFDFHNMSILKALRLFCSRLYIRGETQVIDRILESFSRRWTACNTEEKIISPDIAYIIAFALITLNTDLHTANMDAEQKMRKSAFVDNTMQAIQAVADLSYQESPRRPPLSHSASVASTRTDFSDNTIRFVPRSASSSTWLEGGATNRSLSKTYDNNELVTAQSVLQSTPPESTFLHSPPLSRKPSKRSLHLSESRSFARSRAVYISDLLQDMYISVRNEQIRQPQLLPRSGTNSESASLSSRRWTNPDDGTNGRARSLRHDDLHRNGSVVSLNALPGHRSPAPSTTSLFGRSTSALYNSQHDSRLSLSSRTSVTPSNMTATHNSHSQRGLGFASSLNNVIIREEAVSPADQNEVARIIDESEEDTLTLFGAPFAKEGRVKFRTQELLPGRKSKHKNWSSELFAVLGKGEVKLFDFSLKAMKSRQVTFGGGDWTQNARAVTSILLVQSLAAALPKSARSKARPYVWTLATPAGDIHHFEVGTEALIDEWVSTANYWAARATKEPLLGAVENADYGWGACLESLPPESEDTIGTSKSLSDASQNRTSQYSLPSNDISSRSRTDGIGSPSGNSAILRDWQPDQTPLMTSTLSQEDQNAALCRFITKLEAELAAHNAKRGLIQRAFLPGHANRTKALNNFERCRQHLESEIERYRIYIEALRNGIETAQRLQTERENRNLQELS